jgi:hypothetical protein
MFNYFGQVHLGDNKPCKIVGMGKVKIKQRNGNQWLLKEVKHVPDLSKKLISIWQLASEGCISIFTDKTWKVIKGSLVIAKGENVGTLYICTGNTDSSISLASTGVEIGPRSNKIKQMQKQNTEDTQYKRDTDLHGSPSVGYVHQRNCQVLPLLLSSKLRDTTYSKTHCNFLFFLSQSPLSEYNIHHQP